MDIKKGSLVVLASRPYAGVVALCLSVVEKFSVKGKISTGMIFSGNWNLISVGKRLLAIDSGVSPFRMSSGNYCVKDFEYSARMMIEEKNVQLIFVEGFDDYLDLLDFKNHLIIPHVVDTVLFLQRERLKSDVDFEDAKLIVAKNNYGWQGQIALRYYPTFARFE